MVDQEKINAAILNFLVWGLGFLYLKQIKKGLLWLATFIIIHIGSFFLGWGFLLTAFPGQLMAIGCVLISFNLAMDVF